MKNIVVSILFLSNFFVFQTGNQTADKYLSLSDAEKILGQKSNLTENKSVSRDSVLRFTSTYSTIVNKETSNLYYLLEEYKTITLAKKKFDFIISENRGLSGQKKLSETGDEALWHTDGRNFCLIIVRKNSKILTMKVNKLSSKTSVSEIKKIAKRIALSL